MVIKVYARNDDPYSDMLKNLLKYYSIKYENIEVSRSIGALKEMVDVSGQQTTPVLVVDEKVFVGFDREKIKEILGIGQTDIRQESVEEKKES